MVENDNLLVTYKRALPNSDLPIILSIYDINGRLVSQKNFQINSNENIFDIYFIGGFASGSYILDVIEGNQRVSKTFVK